jgi:allophanate hydrolase subunit 2
LEPSVSQILSEPVLVGSIQIPPDGQPIVTMRDGPTVGGYPKLGLLEAADVSWLSQCRPGVKVRFQLVS